MLRHGLAADEHGPSVCGCGRPGYDVDDVTVHRGGSRTAPRAWVSGVYRCGSGWLCPTCSPAVARVRQARVQRVVEATTAKGGTFVMGLVTVSHGSADRLAGVKALVTESFAAARRGAPWTRIRDRAKVAGVLVAPEVTHGGSGWHFHVHFGMPCLVGDEDMARAAGEALVRRFMRAVAKRGGKAVRKGQGVEVAASAEAAGEYIAKGTAWELAAGSSGHKSRTSGRTHWDIAEDAAAGDVDSFQLWCEYAETMPGSRSCVVTPGMAMALEIEPLDDVEGEHVLEDASYVIGTVPAPTWKTIMRMGLAGTFLTRIETDVADDGAGFADAVSATANEAEARSRIVADLADARRRCSQEDAAEREAQRAARVRISLIEQAAVRIIASDAAGTATSIARAIASAAAANPTMAPLTASEIVRAISEAAAKAAGPLQTLA